MFLQDLDPNVLIAIITGALGYLSARLQTKSDVKKGLEELSMERTRMLSQDQESFRQSLMEEFTRTREILTRTMEHNDELSLQNVDMRRKIIDLQLHNETLLAELEDVKEKNNELIDRVRNLEQVNE